MTPESIRAAYSPEDWGRLTRLKAHYDPHNVFRFNRNVVGSAGGIHLDEPGVKPLGAIEYNPERG